MSSTPPPNDQRIPAGEIQRRAISGSIWTAINTVVYLPVAFAANAIIARQLGVVSYGRLAFLTAVLAVAVPLANLGISTAVVQRGSQAEAAGHTADANDLLNRSLGFQLIVDLPILVVISVALTAGRPVWEGVTLVSAMAVTCVLSGGALSMVMENRTAAGAKIAILVNFLVQIAAVTAAIGTSSAAAVWVVRSVVPTLTLALNLFFLTPKRRRETLRPRLPRSLGRTFWRFALLSWVAALLGLLVFSRSEIFVLQAFHKTEALGLFAVAFGLSQQITAPVDALITPLLPAIAGIVSSWPEHAAQAFARSTRVSALLCGGIAAIVLPTLTFALPLAYGSDFRSAAWLLLPLALVSMFQSVNNPVSAFVNARERAGLRLRATCVALVVDLVLAVALIPPFGAWGAVAANLAGQLTVLIWLATMEPHARQLGIRGLMKLYRPFLVSLGAAAVAVAVGATLDGRSMIGAAAASLCVGALAFLLGLRLTNSGLSHGDRDALVAAMPQRLHSPVRTLLRPITSPSAA